MANSKLTISLLRTLVEGEEINVQYWNHQSSGFPFQTPMVCKVQRTQAYEFSGAGNAFVPFIAGSFVTGFDLDTLGFFNVSYVNATITIEAPNEDVIFLDLPLTDYYNFSIENSPVPVPEYALTSRVVSADPTEPEEYFWWTYTLNRPTRTAIHTGAVETIYDSPTQIRQKISRGIFSTTSFYEDLGGVSGQQIIYPLANEAGFGTLLIGLGYEKLLDSKVFYHQTYDIYGSTVIIGYNWYQYAQYTVLEYSFNQADWFTGDENSFITLTSQPVGDYIIYIRDEFGVVIPYSYSVTVSSTPEEEVFFIADESPINFVNIEQVDDIDTFRNKYNSFPCESKKNLNGFNFTDENLFTNNDKATIQVKSNSESDIEVELRSLDGVSPIQPNVVKRSDNMNILDYRDCLISRYSTGSSLVNIYFDTGNTYDIDGNVTGTYDLSGNLPDYAEVGEIIDVDGFTAIVQDVYFNEDLQANCMVIRDAFTLPDGQGKCRAIYNILPFNIYEFLIDFSVIGNGVYDIIVKHQKVTSQATEYLEKQSYSISVTDSVPNSVAIRYWSNNNKSIFYKYGITNFIRVPFINREASVKDSSQINISDTTSYVVESTIHNVDTFEFFELTEAQARKLAIALSCDNVFIDDIGYVKEGSVSFEQITATNMYTVSCEMIETNTRYTNLLGGQSGTDFVHVPFDVPNIITDGTNFIKE